MKPEAGLVLFVVPAAAEARALATAVRASGPAVELVHDTDAALHALGEARVDGLVTVLAAARIDGGAVLGRARALHPEVCAIVLFAAGEEEGGIAAMRAGAADAAPWPGVADRVLAVLERGRRLQELASRAADLAGRLAARHGFEDFSGAGPALVRLRDEARRVAASDAPLLLVGEAGTGKAILARAVHQLSPRAGERFVQVGPADIESGLAKAGAGTLFVAGLETSPPARDLLVGLAASGRAPARLIAATRPGPEAGLPGFAVLGLPPLRERREDLPLLVDRFVRELNREHGRRVTGVTRAVLTQLATYDWPGNVPELRGTLEGMIVFAEGRRPLDVSDLPLHLRERRGNAGAEAPSVVLPLALSLAEAEKRFMEETLRSLGYDRPRAAESFGIGLRTLYRKLKEYEIG